MGFPPPIPGSAWYSIRRARLDRVSAAAYTNPGLSSTPSPRPMALVAPPALLPYARFLKRWPVSELMRFKWKKAVNPGDVGGPAGSASAKPFLPRVPRPGSADYERRMARQTEKLHAIINSLIAQGQLVQTGISEWTLHPANAIADLPTGALFVDGGLTDSLKAAEDTGATSALSLSTAAARVKGTTRFGASADVLGLVNDANTSSAILNDSALADVSFHTIFGQQIYQRSTSNVANSVAQYGQAVTVVAAGTGDFAVGVVAQYNFAQGGTSGGAAPSHIGALVGSNVGASNQSATLIDTMIGQEVDFLNNSSGTVTTTYGTYYGFYNNAGTMGTVYVVYVPTPLGGGTVNTIFDIWCGDLTGKFTANAYYLWFDSPGVYRVKHDGVMAYYNPAFSPKYTPGSEDFERVVQQWNTNVLEYGTEKGATTGTLRQVRFIGAGLLHTCAADANVGLRIQQHSATQSGNLTEWTDSTGATVKAAVLPGGGVYSAGAFTESAATAGAFLGIVSGTPRWMLANGTNYWECDNASGVLRFIYSTGQKIGVDPVNNFYAFAMNLSVGFDTSTAPPYSSRFWVYHNVAAGTAASNPSVVFEQNTNGTPAAGFGGALVFRAKDSTTSSSLVGELQFVYSTATHASFKGRIIHGVHDSGTSVSSPRMYLQGDTDGARGTSSVPCGGSTSTARVGGGIFDHFADANNGTTVETDLYSDTVAASTLSVNGDKVTAQYGGTFTGDATSTQRLRAYFGGTLIFDSGALGIGVTAVSWSLMVTCIRESSSNVRCSCAFTSSFATLGGDAGYVKVTGLTLTNTQVLKITGTAAGATGGSNQITASEGYVEFKPAA